MAYRKTLALGCCVTALVMSGAAAAQDAQSTSDEPDSETSNAIIVTAQKREQDLQDVSAALSAVGAERLAEARIASIQDLQVVVPSVSIGQDFNIAKIFIRGVGQNTSTTGSEPAVSLHVDGAVVARPEAQLTSLYDLERVEVLRGPQGTLYGRNSTGGSINLITVKPSRTFSAYANATYGAYDQIELEAAAGGPITPGIAFRVAGKWSDRDGFGRNPVAGHDVDDEHRYMARAHLLFDIGSAASLLLTGEYFKQDDHSGVIHFRRASFPDVARLFPFGLGGHAANPRDVASEQEIGVETETWALTSTFSYDISDNITLTNITNYRDFRSRLIQDLDVSGVVNSLATTGLPATIQRRFIISEQFSNELRFNYDAEFVNAVAGLFYFNEDQNPADQIGLTPERGEASFLALFPTAGGITLADAHSLCRQPNPGDPTLPPMRLCVDTTLSTKAYAAFSQIVVSLGSLSPSLESVSIKLGGRYSEEKRASQNPSLILAGGGRGPVNPPAANPPTPIGQIADTYRERTFRDFTPEIGLEWRATDDLLIYYTYSEGFKGGSGENAANSVVIVDPETIKNHELGLKADWFARRLTTNLSLFSYKLEGLQINKTISGGPAGFSTIFQNAAQTEGKGFELEVFSRPTDFLRLGGAVAYTDAKYRDFVTVDPLDPRNVLTAGGAFPGNPLPTAFGAPCTADLGPETSQGPDLNPSTPTCEINLAGNRTRNTPEWTWNLHAELDLPISSDIGSLKLTGDVTYKSDVFFTEFNRLIEGAEAYTLVNAALIFKDPHERFSASLWAKNLTNVFRPSSTFALATGRIVGVTYIPPQQYGVTLGYRF
jgi:iron complex outermembrane receptor protein